MTGTPGEKQQLELCFTRFIRSSLQICFETWTTRVLIKTVVMATEKKEKLDCTNPFLFLLLWLSILYSIY